MKNIWRFHPGYCALFVLILLIEVAIALWVHDSFVRPYLGDVLVVVLIYCFVLSFMNLPRVRTAFAVLLFSFLVEGLQAMEFIYWMDWQDSRLASTLIGTSFSWFDIAAYCAGFLGIIVVERFARERIPGSKP